MQSQLSLFGREEPQIDASFRELERVRLEDGAFVDVVRGWLRGHEFLFEVLRRTAHWRADERTMYDRVVDVPRLYAAAPREEIPIVVAMQRALDARYQTHFTRVTLALYRDGRDSVAWHGDYVARRMKEALVATVSLGSPRRFLLRKTGGGPSIGFSLGWGDLVVMGGSCQRTYQHSIPKVAHAGPRIALMFRPVFADDGSDTAPRADR